ncbi:hypothetical protein EO244_08360 [Ancylomarina salipaludis]|uniref:HD domain-containing protein n=1 Tax=Ancylomarina salipaludis TaxID=2501299 RepID=A0A4Q1JLV7_9BACT|nr:HD domain-containing protein [Ancylomarina salipaludis]RXQ95054.1 hypothetical protein EO244_08360 [Ancylomarina salipaludis]
MISSSFNFDQIKPVNPLLALFPLEPYGIKHAYRVFKLVDKICDFVEISIEKRQVLKFSALFSDIGKEKTMDVNHGFKSYQKLSEHNFLGKSRFNNELCRFLMQCQAIRSDELESHLEKYQIENREEAILSLKVLKDALALDAFRFGNFCAADLELSCSKKLVLFASQFYRKNLNQDFILKEIEDWLSRTNNN